MTIPSVRSLIARIRGSNILPSPAPPPSVVVKHSIGGHGMHPENVAMFGVRFKLPQIILTRDYAFSLGKKLPSGWAELQHIFEIAGVVQLSSYDGPYELFVKKGSAFAWEELEPKIIEQLEALSARKRLEQFSNALAKDAANDSKLQQAV